MPGPVPLIVATSDLLAHTSLVEIISGLAKGDPVTWIAIGAVAVWVISFFFYKKITGRDLMKIPSRKERREYRRRRKKVIWEYERDRERD